MQTSIAKLSLRQSLNSVGLKQAAVPQFFSAHNYTPLLERNSALHVTVDKGRLEIHEYSTDPREPVHLVKTFESLEAFIRAFVVQRIDWACTAYMATVRNDTLEKLKAGDFGEFFEVRKRYEELLTRRLESYLKGFTFAALKVLARL